MLKFKVLFIFLALLQTQNLSAKLNPSNREIFRQITQAMQEPQVSVDSLRAVNMLFLPLSIDEVSSVDKNDLVALGYVLAEFLDTTLLDELLCFFHMASFKPPAGTNYRLVQEAALSGLYALKLKIINSTQNIHAPNRLRTIEFLGVPERVSHIPGDVLVINQINALISLIQASPRSIDDRVLQSSSLHKLVQLFSRYIFLYGFDDDGVIAGLKKIQNTILIIRDRKDVQFDYELRLAFSKVEFQDWFKAAYNEERKKIIYGFIEQILEFIPEAQLQIVNKKLCERLLLKLH